MTQTTETITKFKSVAELRRALTPGTIVTMTRHDAYPNLATIGKPRKLTRVQSNGIQFEGGSWLMYPRASDIGLTEQGFSIVLSVERGQFMEYAVGDTA